MAKLRWKKAFVRTRDALKFEKRRVETLESMAKPQSLLRLINAGHSNAERRVSRRPLHQPVLQDKAAHYGSILPPKRLDNGVDHTIDKPPDGHGECLTPLLARVAMLCCSCSCSRSCSHDQLFYDFVLRTQGEEPSTTNYLLIVIMCFGFLIILITHFIWEASLSAGMEAIVVRTKSALQMWIGGEVLKVFQVILILL